MKKSETENDVENLPRGTEFSTANCPTESTEPIEMTPKLASSGAVEHVIARAIQARSLPLSADEKSRLWRIARDRANRFMVTAPDVDFLLDVIVRLSR